MEFYPFKALALGTRFQYQGLHKIWVKIGHELIAEWDDKKKTATWTAQAICSFSERDVKEPYVFVL